MHASPDANEQPHTGAAVIEDDVPCDGCGYNLRTLAATAACPECGRGVPESLEAHRARMRQRLPLRDMTRVSYLGYIIFGILVPVACMLLSLIAHEAPLSHPQDIRDFGSSLLSRSGTLGFGPLLVFSIISLVMLLLRPFDARRMLAVRLGIFTGVLLAAQYVLIVMAAIGGTEGIVCGIGLIAGSAIMFMTTLTRLANPQASRQRIPTRSGAPSRLSRSSERLRSSCSNRGSSC